MRVLLDECLPRKLKGELGRHEVRTVPEMGWASRSNGELLALAEGRFDVFITVDRNLAFQQNLRPVGIAVVVLVATSNRLASLKPLMPEVGAMLLRLQPGDLVRVGG